MRGTAIMTTTLQELSSPPAPPPPKNFRLFSLDIFRGITIAAMLLVNNPGPGGTYWPLEHADWNGWTPTDMIFPFFIFIMGVAIPFSMAKRRATESRRSLFLHVLARGVSLFLLGEFGYSIPTMPREAPVPILTLVRVSACLFLGIGFILLLYPWKSKKRSLWIPPLVAIAYLAVLFAIHFFNRYLLNNGAVPADYSFGTGIFNPDHLRIPGVLQRIAICYTVAGSLALLEDWRGIVLAAIFFLSVYSALMLGVSYPSLIEPGQMVHGRLDREDNLARYVDVNVFGPHNYHSYPDPEGLLSTLPAISTGLLGLLSGMWLISPRPATRRCAGLCISGVLCVGLGEILNHVLMPINKQIWTPSYVFFAAGLALLGLSVLFYISDILLVRRPFKPFVWYGMNAITAFVLAGIVARVLSVIQVSPDQSLGGFLTTHIAHAGRQITLGDPMKNGSLAFALCFVLFFGVIMGILYRCRIFLKV
jgi:predicted acyltransferase